MLGPEAREHVLVIGVGNEDRGDDAAGLLALRRLRELLDAASVRNVVLREHDGEATSLIEMWRGMGHVVVLDASHCGAPPGLVRRFDAHAELLPAALDRHSTHALGLAHAVVLAGALEALPRRLAVYAIEGRNFDLGVEVSPEAAAGAENAARMVFDQLCNLAAHPEADPCTNSPSSTTC